ncbi:MAG: hypothetical protein WBO46_14945 [Caldilineaceae bacterium]
MDHWLLRNFAGRTLEELDAMDWPRYLRALDAASVERVEERRQRQIAGELGEDKLSASEWETIRAHDELMSGA